MDASFTDQFPAPPALCVLRFPVARPGIVHYQLLLRSKCTSTIKLSKSSTRLQRDITGATKTPITHRRCHCRQHRTPPEQLQRLGIRRSRREEVNIPQTRCASATKLKRSHSQRENMLYLQHTNRCSSVHICVHAELDVDALASQRGCNNS